MAVAPKSVVPTTVVPNSTTVVVVDGVQVVKNVSDVKVAVVEDNDSEDHVELTTDQAAVMGSGGQTNSV